jgi:hypothetical protein
MVSDDAGSLPRWKRELLIALLALAFGLFALPPAIYWVGQNLIGDYAPDAGLWALTERIWGDLIDLEPAAWALVLAPSAVVQLARIARRIARTPKL